MITNSRILENINIINNQFVENDDKNNIKKIEFLKNEYEKVINEIKRINNDVIEYNKTIAPLVTGTELKNIRLQQLQQFNPAVRNHSLNKFYNQFAEIVNKDYFDFQKQYFDEIGGQPIEPDTSKLRELEVKQSLISSLTAYEQRNGYISTELSNQPLSFIKEYISRDSI